MDRPREMRYAHLMQITSASNEKIKHAKRVREGKEPGLIFIEGLRLAEEAFRSALTIEMAFSLSGSELSPALSQTLDQQQIPVFEVTPDIMRALGDTVQPQGIILLAQRPVANLTPDHSLESSLWLGLDRLQDPGNVGTLLRTAEAAGVTGIVALKGCADAYAPKVLRSAMGSAFRLPIQANASAETLTSFQKAGVKVVVAAGDGEMDYDRYDWTQSTLLLLGNEGRGVAPELMQQSDVRLRIPMQAGVESLNVAAAGAVMLFEAARQRRLKTATA
ncbi:TrmH family RNA methyltransferase [Prosthecobacter debontii]|nr:RNA methyltransferase [Prosthecobacter debontii]